jgi:hypothetical protein
MFHTNRHDVIESDDIQDLQHVHITQEGGKPVAWIKAILDPRKDYQALKEVWMHLYNGINQPRMLGPFEHAQPTKAVNAPPEIPIVIPGVNTEPLAVASEAGTLTTTPPSVPVQEEATTAEGSPDVSSTPDTIQLPVVPPPTKGKGN